MNNNIEKFIETIKTPNTTKVVKHVLGNVDVDIEKFTGSELERFVLLLNPNCPKTITTICYILRVYAKWLKEQEIPFGDNLYDQVCKLNKKELWKKAKPNSKRKFMSYEGYKRVIHDIVVYEQYNSLYYKVLLSSIYEGIYNDDLSVLKNLRISDIHGNEIKLHEDNGHTYKLKISNELSENLLELASINIWERQNRFGTCRVKMRGLYNDSVFKIEDRSTASDTSFKFTFYAKLRKISNEYLENPISPFQIYISGIMNRILIELKKSNISREKAFSDNSRNKKAHEIISKELLRCNYETNVGNFREIVKGLIDTF